MGWRMMGKRAGKGVCEREYEETGRRMCKRACKRMFKRGYRSSLLG
jgi:hypothetical protein